jgi:hypothetical protein
MQFSPTSCHFNSLLSKYSPQHPVLKHLQSYVPPLMSWTSFKPIQNHRQNYNFVYHHFYVLDSRRHNKKEGSNWQNERAGIPQVHTEWNKIQGKSLGT